MTDPDHICRYCGKNHWEGSPLPIEDMPWRDIINLERSWIARFDKKPKCTICQMPMVCSQRESHYTCEAVMKALSP